MTWPLRLQWCSHILLVLSWGQDSGHNQVQATRSVSLRSCQSWTQSSFHMRGKTTSGMCWKFWNIYHYWIIELERCWFINYFLSIGHSSPPKVQLFMKFVSWLPIFSLVFVSCIVYNWRNSSSIWVNFDCLPFSAVVWSVPNIEKKVRKNVHLLR